MTLVVAAIIGDPVAQSLSPAMHNAETRLGVCSDGGA